MFKRYGRVLPGIGFLLGIVFAAGLIFGTVALYYIPQEIVEEARETLVNVTEDSGIEEAFRSAFALEFFWMLAVWIVAGVGITAPFSVAVIGLRGFLIGFSATFMMNGEGGFFQMAEKLLPQCLAGVPVMSVFISLCMKVGLERKNSDRFAARYAALGGLFVIVTVITSFFEALGAVLL